jgi:hypothetical protein
MGRGPRISPREPPSPVYTRGPSQAPPVSQPAPQLPQDMELDIPPSPPPVETTLAERRAKRQAILAKYAGSSSTSQSQMPSPSPGPGQGTSSAVHQPPQSIVPVSDRASSQPHSVIGTPGPLQVDVTKSASGPASQYFPIHGCRSY